MAEVDDTEIIKYLNENRLISVEAANLSQIKRLTVYKKENAKIFFENIHKFTNLEKVELGFVNEDLKKLNELENLKYVYLKFPEKIENFELLSSLKKIEYLKILSVNETNLDSKKLLEAIFNS